MAHDLSFANIKMAWSGEIMLRLLATEDMPAHKVAKGDLGGWVAESAEISQDAWVGDDAEVFAGAKVLDDSFVGGTSKVFGENVTVKGRSLVLNTVFSGEGVIENSNVSRCTVTDASYLRDLVIDDALIVNCDLTGTGFNGLQLCQTVAKSPADLVRGDDGGTAVFLSNLELDPADILPEPEITPEPVPAEPEPVPAEPVAPEPVAKVQPAPRAKAEPKPKPAAKKFVQKAVPLAEKLGQGELKFEPIAA